MSTGRYSVTWTCVAECLTDIRYAYTDTLELELGSGAMLLYTPNRPESYAPGWLEPASEGCWEIRGLAEQVLAAWVCPGDGQLDGYLEYQGYPGPPDWLRVWTFAATPAL